MQWEYTFGKKITLTDYYKTYLHETTYSKSTSTVKGYVVDTETTFFKRNTTVNNVVSKSFSYSSGTATRYSYGSKYSLNKPVISLNNNTYTQCTMKVYNPNPVSVTYYDNDVNSSGYTTISAYSTITYNYAWSGGIYDTESHTFQGYFQAYQCYSSSTDSETVSKPYDVKPTLTEPSITIISNTNYSFLVRYTNNASTSVTMYTYNGNFSLSSGGTKDFTVTWSSSSVSLYAWASKSGYNDSDTARTTVTRPSLITPTAPTLEIMSNTYDNWIITIYNPNSYALDVYDNGGNLIVSSLSPKSSRQYGDSWSGTSKTVKCYFMGDSTTYGDSAFSSITITRPSKPVPVTLTAPTLLENNNTYTQCTVQVKNPNSVTCTYYDSDVGGSGYKDIGANSSITYDYAWTKGQYEQESHTFKGYLSASGYTSSTSTSLTISKPYDVKPTTMNSPSMNYTKGTGVYKTKYKVTVSNTNDFAVSATISGDDITTYTVNINANSFTYFYVDILAIEDRTYKTVFSKSGYSDTSRSMTIYV